MIKIVDGSLLDATETILCHQVNCQGVMGSGIARQIREVYPEVYAEYQSYCFNNDKKSLLGSCLLCTKTKDEKIIANIFGQNAYGRDKNTQYTSYTALTNGLIFVFGYANTHNKSIAIPYKIGCGRGNADWNTVFSIIEKLCNKYPNIRVDLVKYAC